jgi:hypothetical protein
MKSMSITPQMKRKCAKAVSAQPESFFDGDNWAGRVYCVNDQNLRQRQRVLEALTSNAPDLVLSQADFAFVYAVLAYTESRKHCSYHRGWYNYAEAYYSLSQRDPYWRKITACFAEVGLKRVPGYEKAWSGCC